MQAVRDTGSGHGHWQPFYAPHCRLLPHPGPPLTSAVRVAMVAGVTAVTVRAVKLWTARAAASLVAALGQGPCGAAATHWERRGTQIAGQGGQEPGPRPTRAHGEALLTLAEGEAEVARGTAVTRGPLEARSAGALARVTVTVAVHHAGAGALARCGTGWVREGPRGAGSQRPCRGWGGARGRARLTLTVLAVEPRGTELAVGALEVGFAQAASQLRVLPTGVVLGPRSDAVTVWGLGGRRESQRRGRPSPPHWKTSLLHKLMSCPFTLHTYKLRQEKSGPLDLGDHLVRCIHV